MAVYVNYVENEIEKLIVANRTKIFSDYHKDEYNSDLLHSHEDHELVVCSTPAAIIVCSGRITRMSGDFAVLYPADEKHIQFNQPKSIYRRFLVRYPRGFLNSVLPPEQCVNDFFCARLLPEDMDQLRPYMDLLLETENEPHSIWTENRQRYLTALIWNTVLRRNSENGSVISDAISAKEERVYDLCRYIHNHHTEKMTIDFLAKKSYLSRATLNRHFRNVMNMSVNEYINQVRCGYALELLRQGYSVKTSAGLSGFADQSYFIKVFKKTYGITPKKSVSGAE